MSAPVANPAAPRLAADLKHAFGGVWRLTFRRFLMPGHLLMLAGSLGFLGLTLYAGTERRHDAVSYFGWVAGFYLSFLVPLVVFITAGGAMRDELRSSTIDYVLTRPIPRWAFIAFKFLAHVVCTQVEFLLAFAVLLVGASMREVAVPVRDVAALLTAQVLVIVAFSAFGILCGQLTSRYVVIGLFYAGVIEVGVGQIPTQLSQLSMTHQIRTALAYLTDPATAASGSLGTATLWLLAFAVLSLGAAAVVFTWREFSGSAET